MHFTRPDGFLEVLHLSPERATTKTPLLFEAELTAILQALVEVPSTPQKRAEH
jgi:hypothetical protein